MYSFKSGLKLLGYNLKRIMDVHFRDLLVSLKYLDFTYTNPLMLRHEADGPVIGKAELKTEKNKMLVNLQIEQHIKYTSLYPRLGIDVLNKTIGYVFLSQLKPVDPEVLTISEQLRQPK